MEWINIEKKWHDMASRLQVGVSASSKPDMPPSFASMVSQKTRLRPVDFIETRETEARPTA